MFVSSKNAQKHFNVSGETLRLWSKNGKIRTFRTKGKHRRYEITEPPKEKIDRTSFIYARVSSRKQRTELDNQINSIRKQYPTHTILSDIGSGINFKRKNFQTILEQVLSGNVKEIVVAHKDRLTRFSFEILEFICNKFNTKITVLSSNVIKTESEELASDLMSIITVFSARYYGRRKYKILQKNKNLS